MAAAEAIPQPGEDVQNALLRVRTLSNERKDLLARQKILLAEATTLLQQHHATDSRQTHAVMSTLARFSEANRDYSDGLAQTMAESVQQVDRVRQELTNVKTALDRNIFVKNQAVRELQRASAGPDVPAAGERLEPAAAEDEDEEDEAGLPPVEGADDGAGGGDDDEEDSNESGDESEGEDMVQTSRALFATICEHVEDDGPFD